MHCTCIQYYFFNCDAPMWNLTQADNRNARRFGQVKQISMRN